MGLLLMLWLASLCAVLCTPAPNPGNGYSAYGIGKTLFDELLPQLTARHAGVSDIPANDTAAWAHRQADVRGALRQLFAPLPPADRARSPRSVATGTLRGEGFSVAKLLVESRPGYWISAGLWLPDGANASHQVPAVLAPSGHDGSAWRDGGSQLIALNLVKRGFAVLGFDPIGQGERSMLPELDNPGGGGNASAGTEHFGCSFEHEHLQRQVALLGVNAASHWLWDLTVLVDFVAAHTAIDRHRLGVAGCSGGGVQAAYLGALDERIGAASVACYTSTLAADFKPSSLGGGGGPAEGEQQWGPFVGLMHGGEALGLDKPDLLVARAPLPTQVLLTTRDQYFPHAGGVAAVAEAAPAFAALGAAAALVSTTGNFTHGYVNETRLALYSFMQASLRAVSNDSGVELQPTPGETWTFADLCVTSTGEVLTAREINNGSGSVTTHEAFVAPLAAAQLAQLNAARGADAAGFLLNTRATAAAVVGCVPPDLGAAPAPVAPTPAPASLPSGTMHYVLPSEGRCRIALDVLLPHNTTAAATAAVAGAAGAAGAAGDGRGAGPTRAVLYVGRKGASIEHPRPGELSAAESARVDAVRAAGFAVVLVDLCGFGTAADSAGDAFGLFDLPSFDFRVKLAQPVDASFNLNRSIVGFHAADVLRAALAASTRGTLLVGRDGSALDLEVVATLSANETAAAVLAAAAVARGAGRPALIGGVALLGSVASWASIVTAPRYSMVAYYSFVFGALRHFDLPDLAAALAPAPVLVALPLGPGSKARPVAPLNASEAGAAFAFARRQHAGLSLASVGSPATLTADVLRWLSEL